MATETQTSSLVITPEELQKHWQEHRRLTRKLLAAFPEDQLFTFAIGGMRTFADLIKELLKMSVPTLRGLVSGDWPSDTRTDAASSTADLLRLWDDDTAEIDRLWPSLPPDAFQRVQLAFGQYEGPGWNLLFYIIDNEIHHRGQGYVYLRALGVEPPAFYDRSGAEGRARQLRSRAVGYYWAPSSSTLNTSVELGGMGPVPWSP